MQALDRLEVCCDAGTWPAARRWLEVLEGEIEHLDPAPSGVEADPGGGGTSSIWHLFLQIRGAVESGSAERLGSATAVLRERLSFHPGSPSPSAPRF